jgi:hypothetical protein
MEKLFETELMISGKPIEVAIYKNDRGNLEWHPKENIFEKGEYCENGTIVEGYCQEIIIMKYI